jgi:hypothetical protein
MRLGLNFDHVRTSSVMTHVLVMSAKVRRSERLWHTLDNGNMFGPIFWLQKFIVILIQEIKLLENLLSS